MRSPAMTTKPTLQFASLTSLTSKGATVVVFLVGGIVLSGWILDIPVLTRISPDSVSMKANTALAFLLAAITLRFLNDQNARRWQRIAAQACASVVTLLGGLSLAQYLLGVDFGIDQLLVTEQAGAVDTSHAGRMAPATALNFLFIGMSLLVRSRQVLARILVSVMATVALYSCLGHGFGVTLLSHLGPFTPMALHTSLAFVLTAISFLSVRIVPSKQFAAKAGFWIAVATLFYIGVISYWNTVNQTENSKSVAQSYEVLQKLEELQSDIKEVEASVRGFGLTGHLLYLEKYDVQADFIETHIADLRRLTPDNPSQLHHIEVLEPIVKDELSILSEIVALGKVRGSNPVASEKDKAPRARQLMDEIRAGFGAMKREEQRLLQERRKKSEETSREAVLIMVFGTVGSSLLLGVVLFLLVRENRIRTHAELASKRAEEEARILNAELEQRVAERTVDLTKAFEALHQTEERFKLVVAGISAGIWDWNVFTGKEWWSPKFYELLGYEDNEVEASLTTFEELLHPDDKKATFDLFQSHFDLNKPFVIEYRLKKKSGDYGWFLGSGQAEFDADNQPFRMVGSIIDITERKQAVEAKRASEEWYRHTLDNMLEGCQIIGFDWRYRYVNESAARHGRRRKEELPGKTMMEVYPGIETTEMFAALRHCMEKRSTQRMENEFTYPDGTKQWFDLSIQPVPEGIFILSVDITERRQAEEALIQLKRHNELILNSAGEGLLGLDTNGIITFANPAAARMLESSTQELVGKPGHANHHHSKPDGTPYPREECPIYEAFRTGVAKDVANEVFWRRDGTSFPVDYTSTPLRDNSGGIVGAVVVFKDISLQKQAEEALEKSESLFRELFEFSPDGVIIVNSLGIVVRASQRAESLFGYSRQELVGMDIGRLIPARFANHKTLREEYMADPQRRPMGIGRQLFARRKDGSEFPVEISLSPRESAKEIIATIRDITEKKRLEGQFLRVQRIESIGSLASGIAHDLNNVLAPIMLCVDLIKRKNLDEPTLRMLETVETSAKRGSDLIKQVLSFARGVEGDRSTVQIRHLIGDIEKIVKETFPKSISLRLDILPNLWTTLADATQLHQVLMNLCVNARDAMPHGGIIQVKAQNRILDEQYSRMNLEAKPGSYVEVSITDAGMGMPPEILERIFEPFFTTKAIGKGTGLGLSTAYAIVKSHGGFINVYSEVGKGTTFRVYIPAQTEGKVPTLGEKHDHPLGRGELILVVDDEAAIREITRATLEAYGYSVVTAIDGTEAIAIYVEQKDSIALVLTDMMMPFLDGTATVRALQKINPQVKILVVSGLTQNAPSSTFSGEKTVRFLHKPFTSETLLTELRLLLESSDEPMGRH